MPATAGAHPPASRGADLLGLAGFGAAVLVVALVGTWAAADSRSEYAALDRPAWAPPGWVFGPVWTILYVMIAVAGWLVWHGTGLDRVLLPYAVQLVLNALWTPIFFGAGAYGLAAVEIVALWCAIGATVFTFRRVHRVAAALLLPYWAWVTFAAMVNVAVWWANR